MFEFWCKSVLLFAATCVPLPRAARVIKPGSRANGAYRDQKFICPICHRTKRPNLDHCLQLLAEVPRITLRIPEVEAFQCLCERAMDWQERARTVFNSRELAKSVERIDPDYYTRMRNFLVLNSKATGQNVSSLCCGFELVIGPSSTQPCTVQWKNNYIEKDKRSCQRLRKKVRFTCVAVVGFDGMKFSELCV